MDWQRFGPEHARTLLEAGTHEVTVIGLGAFAAPHDGGYVDPNDVFNSVLHVTGQALSDTSFGGSYHVQQPDQLREGITATYVTESRFATRKPQVYQPGAGCTSRYGR